MKHFAGVLALACAFFALSPQGLDHQQAPANFEFKRVFVTPGADLSVCTHNLAIPGISHRRERLISGTRG